jgi:hypothetical protein
VKNAQELIGGSINMQIFFPKKDWAWTVENDLIVTKSSKSHIKPAISPTYRYFLGSKDICVFLAYL